MRVIILIILCALISSCGVFKNTSKDVFKEKSGFEAEHNVKSEIDLQDNSILKEVNTSIRSSHSVKGRVLSADKIIFNTDGSFSAEGNAQYEGIDVETKNESDSSQTDALSALSIKEKTSDKGKVKAEESVKTVNKESKPSSKGIITGAIAVLLVVIVCAWWFFGIGKKKK